MDDGTPGSWLNVVDQGRGSPALVFLHHITGSSRAWSPVIERLAADHRCVAVDLRGFGAPDAPATEHDVDDSVDDVAARVARLGLGRYALVGHSIGGKIALARATRRSPGVDALVLVAPSPPTPEPMS